MEELKQLAELIRKRNQIEKEITRLIGRPAAIGHIGEFVASRVFQIELEESASHKGNDGRFTEGALKGKTVNVKWYARQERLLDINLDSFPDYFLVLSGQRSNRMSSRGQTRPWRIESVYLFDAQALIRELKVSGIKIGVATSIRQSYWDLAEIFPSRSNPAFQLTDEEWQALAWFR